MIILFNHTHPSSTPSTTVNPKSAGNSYNTDKSPNNRHTISHYTTPHWHNQIFHQYSPISLDIHSRTMGDMKCRSDPQNSTATSQHVVWPKQNLCSQRPPPTTGPRKNFHSHQRRTSPQIETIHANLADHQQQNVHPKWTQNPETTKPTQYTRHPAIFPTMIVTPFPKQCGSSLFCLVPTWYNN